MPKELLHSPHGTDDRQKLSLAYSAYPQLLNKGDQTRNAWETPAVWTIPDCALKARTGSTSVPDSGLGRCQLNCVCCSPRRLLPVWASQRTRGTRLAQDFKVQSWLDSKRRLQFLPVKPGLGLMLINSCFAYHRQTQVIFWLAVMVFPLITS